MKRRTLLLCGAAAILAGADGVLAARPEKLDVFAALKTRRSVRSYTAESVAPEDIDALLEAAMLAPSAVNEQPWEFVVIQDRALLAKIGTEMRNARMAASAPLAILVCLNEAREKIRGMGIIDVAMSSENLLLAAHGLGLGAVFTGIFPDAARVAWFREAFSLPDGVLPFGLIVIGHPAKPESRTAPERYNRDVIHRDKW